LFLVFCNLPGQEVARLRFGDMPPLVADMDIEYSLEHGWPLSFATRTSMLRSFPFVAPFGSGTTLGECFRFWSEVDEFRPVALLINAGVALLLAGAVGTGFEAWRRSRKAWQVHLRDLSAVILVVSVVGAWYLNARQEYAAQERILRPQRTGDHSLPELDCTYKQGGFTWLRLMLGDAPFEFLDRPVQVMVADEKGWKQLAILRDIPRVDSTAAASSADLCHLARMPHLQALSLWEPDFVNSRSVELPPLPNLKGLELSHFLRTACRGIDRAPSLEVVRISQSKVDDRTFQELSRLPKLRELSLDDVEVTADRLLTLSSLPKLRALELQHASLDASALRAIGRFQNLTYLELWGCSLAEGELKEVASLSRLQTLRLPRTNVASQDLAPLVGLPLRELYLGGTQVDSEAIPHLLKLIDLRQLVVPYNDFSLAEQKLLRERLPQCEIHFE
jgi:hypothetical protein